MTEAPQQSVEGVAAGDRRQPQTKRRVLFVGPALLGASRVFRRENDSVSALHAETSRSALELIRSAQAHDALDCVFVDQRSRSSAGAVLHLTALAMLVPRAQLVALGNPDELAGVAGVRTVLQEPVSPVDIIRAVLNVPEDEGADSVAPEPDEGSVPKAATIEVARPVTPGFETTLSRIDRADRKVWARFVPIANFLYKKTAILVLSGLFLAFLTYGVLIVFFMGSSSWSSPVELTRGHSLVQRVERQLSTIGLQINDTRQKLSSARAQRAEADRMTKQAEGQIGLARSTVAQELREGRTLKAEIEANAERLAVVLRMMDSINGEGGSRARLEDAFERRLITKQAFESGVLTLLDTVQKEARVRNELAERRARLKSLQGRIAFLETLASVPQEKDPAAFGAVAGSGGKDFAAMTGELLQAHAQRERNEEIGKAADDRAKSFESSMELLVDERRKLLDSPMGRAISDPVSVLFVPYANLRHYEKGATLRACRFMIIFCRRVGTVGPEIDGESTIVHPLFGKPVRGVFVEARFKDRSAAKKELIHVGRAPFFL